MDYKAQIDILLSKNLVLKQATRDLIVQKLPSLEPAKAQKLIELLTNINTEQDAGLVSMLEKNPNFFKDLEQVIIKTMKADFEAREAPERFAAEENLDAELSNI